MDPAIPDPPPLSKVAWMLIGGWLLGQLFISGVVSTVFQDAHTSIESAAAFGMAAEGLVVGASRAKT
jgi:hypothetical protein